MFRNAVLIFAILASKNLQASECLLGGEPLEGVYWARAFQSHTLTISARNFETKLFAVAANFMKNDEIWTLPFNCIRKVDQHSYVMESEEVSGMSTYYLRFDENYNFFEGYAEGEGFSPKAITGTRRGSTDYLTCGQVGNISKDRILRVDLNLSVGATSSFGSFGPWDLVCKMEKSTRAITCWDSDEEIVAELAVGSEYKNPYSGIFKGKGVECN